MATCVFNLANLSQSNIFPLLDTLAIRYSLDFVVSFQQGWPVLAHQIHQFQLGFAPCEECKITPEKKVNKVKIYWNVNGPFKHLFQFSKLFLDQWILCEHLDVATFLECFFGEPLTKTESKLLNIIHVLDWLVFTERSHMCD